MTNNPTGEPRVDLNVFMPGRRRRPKRLLLDRDSERTRIDDLLDVVLQGFSGVLVLRGCHGAGKTTLIDYAVEEAAGFRISSIVGVQSAVWRGARVAHPVPAADRRSSGSAAASDPGGVWPGSWPCAGPISC